MIHLIQVPYDSGHFDARMGRGPSHLVTHGAAERLRGAGVTVCESVLRVENNFPTETAVTFDVLRETASAVREACADGMVPLVLAGNCNTTVGVVGGLQSPDVGVIWLDAHADFSTPESSSTGFIDGMGVAMLTGRCWTAATRTIPGFAPVPDECVLLVGQRDFDDDEVKRLEASAAAPPSGLPHLKRSPNPRHLCVMVLATQRAARDFRRKCASPSRGSRLRRQKRPAPAP